jgi:hypothetical protein
MKNNLVHQNEHFFERLFHLVPKKGIKNNIQILNHREQKYYSLLPIFLS